MIDELKIAVHQKRDVNILTYDIAIITLTKNVTFTELVKPICIGDMNVPVKPGDKVHYRNIQHTYIHTYDKSTIQSLY